MENEDKTDYNTKILNFMAMTEIGDPDVANKYLQQANWDETTAANIFFSQISPPQENNNININPNHNERNTNNNQNNNNEGLISRFIFGPLKFIFGSCMEKREIDREDEDEIFQELPNKTYNYQNFCTNIKRKIGIIILYTGRNVQFLRKFIIETSKNDNLMNLLRKNCFIFPLLASTNEGYQIKNIISENQFFCPVFAFCYKNGPIDYENQNILSRNDILYILEGENISISIFESKLLDCIDNLNNNSDFGIGMPLTDGEILEQQKSDMEILEKEAQKKEEEKRRQKIIEQQKQKEEERKKKELEKKIKEAKSKVVSEPDINEPNVTTICFRYPDGEKRVDRRFLKSHTVQNLYDFVTSLGKEIYSEENNSHFSLYQPFPPKKYEQMDNTLENEGLFPNAIIQIREEE